ncbi:MAG: TPM domain-containing protein [Chitinophagaceae bacterium]|nr:TPM domain-containing protein [Chitinophagaceae bacterium]
MRTHLFTLLFLLSALCIGPNKIHAQSTTYDEAIPALPSTPRLVNDLANMLQADEEVRLEKKLLKFERESSNEVTIITVDTLGGLDISEFAVQLGRKWNIGKAERKNGVIILVSAKDRKINISPGYGLSGVLPDAICARIIRNQITPNFRSGNVYQGFDEATDAIIAASKGEFSAYEKGNGISPFILLLIMFGIFLFIFIFFFAIRNRKQIYVSRRGYKYDDNSWGGGWLGGFGSGMGSGGGFGGGGGSDDSFGGFGGGGGGFDGGGASGSW